MLFLFLFFFLCNLLIWNLSNSCFGKSNFFLSPFWIALRRMVAPCFKVTRYLFIVISSITITTFLTYNPSPPLEKQVSFTRQFTISDLTWPSPAITVPYTTSWYTLYKPLHLIISLITFNHLPRHINQSGRPRQFLGHLLLAADQNSRSFRSVSSCWNCTWAHSPCFFACILHIWFCVMS